MPVLARGMSLVSTAASGRGCRAPGAAPGAQRVPARPRPAAGTTGASTAVFHAPHDVQRPNQRDASLPHCEQ